MFVSGWILEGFFWLYITPLAAYELSEYFHRIDIYIYAFLRQKGFLLMTASFSLLNVVPETAL